MNITLSGVVTGISVAVVVALGATYVYEYSAPPSDYFEFYGHIVKNDVFTAPEEILSFTFGKAVDADKIKLDFNNQLWCAPLDSGLHRQLVQNLVAHFDYHFGNPLEGLTLAMHDADVTHPAYTQEDIDQVRASDDYFSWPLHQLRPDFDSECHVSTIIATQTPIFNIDKSIRSRGPSFDYIVGTSYSGTEFDGSPYDDGKLESLEDLNEQIIGIRTKRLNETDIEYAQPAPFPRAK